MKKKLLLSGAIPGIAVLCVALFLSGIKYSDNKLPNFRRETELFVFPEMTPAEVLAAIPDSLVRRPASLRRVFRKAFGNDLDDGSVIRPGHYVIDPARPSVYVPRMLRAGWQTPVKLVLSGSLRQKGEIARKIGRQLLLDSATVFHVLNDSAALAPFGFTPRDVFSLFNPDTYELYWTASVEEVLQKQKASWDAFWTPENLEKARARGLTPKEVSILASIVKGESNYAPEYPAIAGVYLNRLHCRMKLQADPTVAFCFDYTLNRIYRKHLEVDSPYNTYLHEGLPPGPICVPTRACLQAVLDPDRHGYLFFCASPALDGTHKFATTLAEHNRNAREFQRALDARSASGSVGSGT